MNQPRLKSNAVRSSGVAVGVRVGVEVLLGEGVSLGGGVTRADAISASSVPNKLRLRGRAGGRCYEAGVCLFKARGGGAGS